MSDKELADKVVALGVGSKCVDRDRYDWSSAWTDAWQTDRMCKTKPEAFVRDWRVAGALMEKLNTLSTQKTTDGWLVGFKEGWVWEKTTISNESLPRAIIEAGVEALDKGHDREPTLMGSR